MGRLLLGVCLIFTLVGFSQKRHEDRLVGNIKEVHLHLGKVDQIALIQSKEKQQFSISCQADYMVPGYDLEYENEHVFINSRNDGELIESETLIGKDCSEDPRYNSYTLSIPEGAKVFVHLDHGNVYSSELNNQLYVKSTSGIIKIKPRLSFTYVELERGNIYIEDPETTNYQLKTRKGKLFWNGTNLTAQSLTGTSWKHTSKKADSKVEIITVSANIYIDSSKPKI